MIRLDANSETSLYEQLYEQIRDDIASGKLKAGTRLSSLRDLAQKLGISRTTVSRAYDQLIAEGYVHPLQGSGFYVEDIGPTTYPGKRPSRRKIERPKPQGHIEYDFKIGCAESALFPWNKWRKAICNAIDHDSFQAQSCESSAEDAGRLRECLASSLYQYRGVRCGPEQIIMCPGPQHAMDIILSLFDPCIHHFAFEEPGWGAMRSLAQARHYSVSSIPVIDSLSIEVLDASNRNVLYTTPSFHVPQGSVMSLRNRNLLLRWATRNDAYIIENDHNGRMRSASLPEIPSLQSLDMFGNVIYMGSMNQVLPESLRLAYLVLPPALMEKYEEQYPDMPSMLPNCYERAWAELIEDGTLSRHIAKIGVANKRKLDLISTCIIKFMAPHVCLSGTSPVSHVIVKVRGCRDQNKLLERLEESGIRIYSLHAYHNEWSRRFEDMFILGFSSLSENDIVSGCMRMGAIVRDFLRKEHEQDVRHSLVSVRRANYTRYIVELRESIVHMDGQMAAEAARKALAAGAEPLDCIESGLASGMKVISDMFDEGQAFVPELVNASEAFKSAAAVLTAAVADGARTSLHGTAVIYTVAGDIHDIGKNIVRMLLEANRLEVYDLGRDVKPDEVLEKAQEVGADIILGSSLMTTTMTAQRDLIEYLEAEGVRDKYYVMFGGAPVTAEWVAEIGGDCYTDTATEAVAAAKRYLAKRPLAAASTRYVSADEKQGDAEEQEDTSVSYVMGK
jgi:GntR family transcriptional regulator/MocR family aminotransferase